MKESKLFVGFALLFFAFAAFGISADGDSWTGWVADERCAQDYNKAATADHAGCAKTCLKRGQKVALSTSDGHFLLDLSAAQADEHIGHEVTVKGDLDSATNTITVSSVSAAHSH